MPTRAGGVSRVRVAGAGRDGTGTVSGPATKSHEQSQMMSCTRPRARRSTAVGWSPRGLDTQVRATASLGLRSASDSK